MFGTHSFLLCCWQLSACWAPAPRHLHHHVTEQEHRQKTNKQKMHQHLIFFQSHWPSIKWNTHKVCQWQTLKLQLWNKRSILLLTETDNDSKVQQSESLEVLASGQMDNTLTDKATQTVTSHTSGEKWWLLQVPTSPCESIAAANRSCSDWIVGQKGKDGSRLTFFSRAGEVCCFEWMDFNLVTWTNNELAKQWRSQKYMYLPHTHTYGTFKLLYRAGNKCCLIETPFKLFECFSTLTSFGFLGGLTLCDQVKWRHTFRSICFKDCTGNAFIVRVRGPEPWVLQRYVAVAILSEIHLKRSLFSKVTWSVPSYLWDLDHCLKVLPSDESGHRHSKRNLLQSEFLAWGSQGITQKCKFSEAHCKKGVVAVSMKAEGCHIQRQSK